MTVDWLVPGGVQLVLSGAAFHLAIVQIVRQRTLDGRRSLLLGAWSSAVALTLLLNGLLLLRPTLASDAYLVARTVAVMGAVLFTVPAVGAVAGRPPPPWLLPTLGALAVLRTVLFVTTDLVYGHAVAADGSPVYGDGLVLVSAPFFALVGVWLVDVALGWVHEQDRGVVVVAIVLALVLAGGSLATAGWAAEALTGLWVVPLLAALEVVSVRSDEQLARDRQRLQEQRDAMLADLSRTNEQLQAALRIRDDVLAVTGHELKTPLTPLRGLLELLVARHSVLDEAEIERYLVAVNRNAERLESLLDDLLDAARVQQGGSGGLPEVVEVEALLEQAVALWPELNALEFVCDPGARAWVDPTHLARIATNLLSNAVKYGAPPYRLEAHQRGERVEIVVEDHGPGVPETFRDALYDPYARGPADGAAPGVGLGLAITKMLTEASGGRLRFEPVHPSGARFVVELPAADETGDTGPDVATGERHRASGPNAGGDAAAEEGLDI